MSEGTTKPNGSREMNIEETETKEIEKRIKAAGYDGLTVNALQAYFSQEKVQEDGANSGSADNAKPTKAGDHTLVPNTATVAFKPLIPYIASGAKAKLKDNKTKAKEGKKSNIKNERKSNTQTSKRDIETHDDIDK